MPTPSRAPGNTYRLIDTDTHVNEPPDLWTSRVPAHLRDRAPRMEHFEQGDGWVGEGVAEPINFGLNVSATLPRSERSPWARFDQISRGGYDPVVRLAEMDEDLVDAAVFYPTPRLSNIMIGNKDPELHLALVQAYNDWVIEYCAHDPSRMGAIFLVPNRGVDQALQEIKRVGSERGVVGALIGCWPHGDTDFTSEDDPVFEALAEQRLAAHIHVGLVNELPQDIYTPGRLAASRAEGDLRFMKALPPMMQLLQSGVLDRVPDLPFVMVEVDAGWLPYVKEQMDNRVRRRPMGPNARLQPWPSEVIHERFYFTYITDEYAIHNRRRVGVDRLMWSSDFPHSGADWPNSWRTIDATFGDVPPDERQLILAGNAMRLYRFGDS